MKFFQNRLLFPLVFGLSIYLCIRLITDSMSKEQFWERSLKQNAIELAFVAVFSYLFDTLLRSFIKQFQKKERAFSFRQLFFEFGKVLLFCLLFFNPGLYLVHYLSNDPLTFDDIIIANIVVGLFALLYYSIGRGNGLLQDFIKQKIQLERAENIRLETELNFLKAQYHPHFLFNGLNTIYFQIDENAEVAKSSVLQFSELLRYQLYDHHKMIPLKTELDYLRNYIAFQKQRVSDKLEIELNIDDSLNEKKVYPLLFAPLVENAFKYLGGDFKIRIQIGKTETGIYFEIENSIPAKIPDRNGGIGLANLQRRLEILYPEKHKFETRKDSASFMVRITIPLNEDQVHNNR